MADDGEKKTEKGIEMGHTSALMVTTRTKDSVKGKSVANRLYNLECFLREHIATIEEKVFLETN